MALYDKGLPRSARATTAALANHKGESGQLFMDTAKNTLVLMDGVKNGGFSMAREDRNIIAGSDNIKINGGESANLSGDITITFEGGGGDTVIVSAPTFTLPEKVSNTNGVVNFVASASSMLVGGSISHFLLTVDALNIKSQRFNATDNSAVINFTVPNTVAAGTDLQVFLVAVDANGNKSPATVQSTTVISVSVNAPTITTPVSGSKVTISGGSLTVITSPFATTGEVADTQKSTDWQLMGDAAGTNIIAQAMNSTDLTQHTFTGLDLTDGQTYYLRARHEGNQGGKSPWSAVVSFIASKGTVVVEGRTAYKTADGIVLEFFDPATNQVLRPCFAPAAKRKAGLAFDPRTSYVDYSLPNLQSQNTQGTWYIDGTNTTVSMEAAAALTEARFNQLWPGNILDPNTAKYNCDTLIAAYGLAQLPALNYARGIMHSSGQPFNIGNIQELMRGFCSRAIIDSLDETVADYPALSMTSWFNNGWAWSSSECNNYNMRGVSYDGYCYYGSKGGTSGVVVPVLEILG